MRYLLVPITLIGILFILLNYQFRVVDISESSYQAVGNSPAIPLWNTNWVATDALGRKLPTPAETGPARPNKYIGIFYFLWHGFYKEPIYDISKLLRANPTKPSYGPKGAFHWWGEPEAGYYKADDPWIIRRNLQMLTNAGIDILFMDVTNGGIYAETLKKICDISQQMRQQGQRTPYICFVTNSMPRETVSDLYTNFYTKKQYSELWFRWEGKPLILGKQEEISDQTQRSFFTWRFSWQFTDAKTQPGHWQWLDTSPQDYGWVNDPNKPEEIPVAVASHPVFGVGKSTADGRARVLDRYYLTKSTNEGIHFSEQWKRALEVDPSVVFVTGWNEWIAQRFVADTNDHNMVFKNFIDHKMHQGESFFMDLYNEEFNRDIEPMKGGYTDNYYYQLIAYVRRFKGLNPVEAATSQRTLHIDGKFTEWQSIKPIFNDSKGDVMDRNWLRSDNKARLINKTGRNDIIESRVTYDANFIYIYTKTVKPITTPSGRNWMLLFIDTDQSKKTGWEGYDLIINRNVGINGQTSIDRWIKNRWQSSGKAAYRVVGNELEISIPRKIPGVSLRPNFDFHWADNIQKLNDINEFFLNGESAPDRRFNYRYSGR